MVRLKVGVLKEWIDEEYVFQFHNGSIKRNSCQTKSLNHTKFQFHNGSIKRFATDTRIYFVSKFQFHNGSIKRNVDAGSLSRSIMFQFHNGSIKRLSTYSTTPSAVRVSIPQWFD